MSVFYFNHCDRFSVTDKTEKDSYTYLFQVCGNAGGLAEGGLVQRDASGKEVIIGKYTATEVFGGCEYSIFLLLSCKCSCLHRGA